MSAFLTFVTTVPLTLVPAVSFTFVPAVPLTLVPALPLTLVPGVPLTLVTTVPLTPMPRPFQVVKRLLIRIVPFRQLPFIEIIRGIRIAQVGVFFHILFCLIVRA